MTQALDTSAMAMQAVGLRTLATGMDVIEGVIRDALHAGAVDISMREIQMRLHETRGVKHNLSSSAMEGGSISARVNGLVAAGRVLRLPDVRKCTVTRKDIHPLTMPLKQGRLVP